MDGLLGSKDLSQPHSHRLFHTIHIVSFTLVFVHAYSHIHTLFFFLFTALNADMDGLLGSIDLSQPSARPLPMHTFPCVCVCVLRGFKKLSFTPSHSRPFLHSARRRYGKISRSSIHTVSFTWPHAYPSTPASSSQRSTPIWTACLGQKTSCSRPLAPSSAPLASTLPSREIRETPLSVWQTFRDTRPRLRVCV